MSKKDEIFELTRKLACHYIGFKEWETEFIKIDPTLRTLNHTNYDDRTTPLINAIRLIKGRSSIIDIINLLHKYGALLDFADYGNTPFMEAVERRNFHAMYALKELGVNPDSVGSQGLSVSCSTPLTYVTAQMLYLKTNNAPLISLLVAYGAKLTTQDPRGRSFMNIVGLSDLYLFTEDIQQKYREELYKIKKPLRASMVINNPGILDLEDLK